MCNVDKTCLSEGTLGPTGTGIATGDAAIGLSLLHLHGEQVEP